MLPCFPPAAHRPRVWLPPAQYDNGETYDVLYRVCVRMVGTNCFPPRLLHSDIVKTAGSVFLMHVHSLSGANREFKRAYDADAEALHTRFPGKALSVSDCNMCVTAAVKHLRSPAGAEKIVERAGKEQNCCLCGVDGVSNQYVVHQHTNDLAASKDPEVEISCPPGRWRDSHFCIHAHRPIVWIEGWFMHAPYVVIILLLPRVPHVAWPSNSSAHASLRGRVRGHGDGRTAQRRRCQLGGVSKSTNR